MDDYQYQPLDTQRSSIRLLRLLKGDTINIYCEIFHTAISDSNAIHYEALSYTWGSIELVDSVEIDGRRLYITENLYSTLQCLRYHDKDRILWIDAICINQSDKQERSEQVLEMGKIFGFATRVIFWLGKPTAEAALLMDSLSELQTKIEALSQNGTMADSTTWKTLWSSVHQKQESPKNSMLAQQREGLETLLRRPWFDRVWILQEVLNAQSAIVCSGVLAVSADVFAFSPSLFDLNVNRHVHAVLSMMPRSESQQDRERENLANLLLKFRACKATDERDMVFALLGMSSEPFENDLLRPNYTLPMLEVVRNTIQYWCEATDVTMSQILHSLGCFQNVRVAYLIPLERTTNACERIEIPIPSGKIRHDASNSDVEKKTVRCIRDVSLFQLEKPEGEVVEERETLHTELSRLHSKLEAFESKDLPYRIALWQTVIILIVIDKKETILTACRHKCVRVIDFVMDRTAYNKRDLLTEVLHKAVRRKYWNAVQLLVDKGADINSPDPDGHYALVEALTDDQSEVVELLIEAGANLNVQGESFGTPLQLASEMGRVKLAQKLIDSGAVVNAQGGPYGNALQAASRRPEKHRSVKMVKLLLKHGADVNAQGGFFGNALQSASEGAPIEVVQLLIDKGANVNAQGGYCGNALQAASSRRRVEVVQLLIDNGANVSAQGGHYGSAIQAASIVSELEIMQLLIDNGADVNAQGGCYGSALEAASQAGELRAVQLLVDNGADVNAQVGHYGSVLHAASRRGNSAMVQMLVDKGADVNAQGGEYGSALELATKMRHEHIVRILRKHGARDISTI